MNILFVTQDFHQTTSVVRAVWPALWINKYSEHNAWVIDAHQATSVSFLSLLDSADVLVCNKAHSPMKYLAEKAIKRGIPVVYDTDDHDEDCFGRFYISYELAGVVSNVQWFRENAQGITVASHPLAKLYPGSVVIENGFDLTPNFTPPNEEYFRGNEGRRYKIAWGGSKSHEHDIEMFLRLGVAQRLADELPVDFYFYNITESEHTRNYKRGKICTREGTYIDWYIYELFRDADVLIAPLVQNEFNNYRSTLKLVEAGFVGKPIVASRVESYENYTSATLVNNTAEEWYSALRELILDDALRNERSSENKRAAYEHYTAEILTQQRIDYFKGVQDAV